MTEAERWIAANDRYLATELAWLRDRLERLAIRQRGAAPAAPPASPPAPPLVDVAPLDAEPPRSRSLLGRLLGSESAPADVVRALPAVVPPSPPPATDPAPAGAATTEDGGTPALALLAERLGLSEFDRLTLLLCAAMELDTGIAGLCARAQDAPGRPYPTFALALTLFDHAVWDAMSPERPLRYWRLLEINQPGAQPLVTSALKADERIVNYIKGLNHLDERLAPLLAAVAPDVGELPGSQARVASALAGELQRAAGGALPVVQMLGADSEAKRMVAAVVAANVGLSLYRLAVEELPLQTADLETFIRLWQRETILLPIAIYIDAGQLDRGAGAPAAGLRRLFTRGMGATFFDTREPWPDLGRPSVMVDVAKPTALEQQAAWQQALGDSSAEHPARLAAEFSFNGPALRAIATAALAPSDDSRTLGDRLWARSLEHGRPALDQLAVALDAKATWDDLELPIVEKQILWQVGDQVKSRLAVYDTMGFRERMSRGLGISVLFAGESGTGKTMAAEVMANETGLLLYRIDLSAVVSKYIGETEKNLRKLFDTAEDGGAILFFDEADALFGKRSEVKDSHDRYANIEINYLLQRMESYRGLAILATNMKSALDSAFMRRLRFIVNFPFPGPAERRAIWARVFPAQAPTADLDYTRLSRLTLTGGSIHNIALNAAFLAARAGTPITMPLVLDAARAEFRKLEKPINESDFRWLEAAGGSA